MGQTDMALKRLLLIAVIAASAGSVSAAECSQDGSSYTYTESVTTTTRTIVTNHCPNHPFYNNNPNYAVSTATTTTVPAKPQLKGTVTDPTPTTGEGSAQADLAAQGGSIGVFFDGGMLYSPFPGGAATTSFATSATYKEGNTFDQCGGHSSTTSQASYHYHVPPSRLMSQLGTTTTDHSPQIGWAADGFPVYGSRGPGGTMMKTCTVTGGTYGTDSCTDACGGMYKDDNTIDNFKYRYYMQGTYNDGTLCTSPSCPSPGADYYPNSPMCYRGCCPTGVSCASIIGTCSGTFEDGYTSSYTPSTTASNGAAGAGTDMASGLAINTGGCACGSLSCDASICATSSQSWESTNCIGGNTNTCPATTTTTAPTTAANSAATIFTLSTSTLSLMLAMACSLLMA